MTEFSELVGDRILQYVPIMDARHPFDDDANAVAFCIDGTWFLATEDPKDGYRSCMGTLHETFSPNWDREVYLAEHVEVSILTSQDDGYGDNEHCEILSMKSKLTGKVVFEVGTSRTDDYYPSFVANWQPENLSVNNKKD